MRRLFRRLVLRTRIANLNGAIADLDSRIDEALTVLTAQRDAYRRLRDSYRFEQQMDIWIHQ